MESVIWVWDCFCIFGLHLVLQEQKALVKAFILRFALQFHQAFLFLLPWKIVEPKNHYKARFQKVLL